MHTARAAVRRTAAHALTAALVLSGAVVATAAPASAATTAADDVVTIDEGTVTWGVRTSWRGYAGPGQMSEGLTANSAGEFQWKVEDGTYDPATQRLELHTSGKVHWELHEGALDVTLSNLTLVVDGEEPQVFVDTVSKSESGETVDYGSIALVDLDLEAGTVSEAGGVTTWTGLTSSLAAIGQDVFARFYSSGAPFDTVSATYTGPGGKPAIAKDDFLRPGSIGLPEVASRTEDVLADATSILPDTGRNIIHLASATSLRPYDATTLEPLAAAQPVAFYNGWTSYPGPVSLESAGVIVGNSGGKLVAATWDPATGQYTTTVLSDTPGNAFTYRASQNRVYVASAQGVLIVQHTAATGPRVLSTYPWAATAPSFSRPSIAVGPDGSVVIADASKKPQLVRLLTTDGVRSAAVSDLPGDYTNDRATQAYFQYPTEAVATGTGFRLTNYQGRIYTVVSDDDTLYTRSGPIVDTGLNQVLRSTYDSYSDTWYLADWGATKVYGVRGDNHVQLTVPSLGTSVLETVPVTGASGRLYAVAARQGDSGEAYGLFSWKQEGLSPTITTQPTQPVVTLPDWESTATTTLTVAATGTPAPALQWQTRPVGATSVRSWTDIDGATGPTLALTLGVADQGRQYRAVATNSVGRLGTDVLVADVKTPPAVIFQPTDASVTAGDDATFLVMPKGNPYPEITWQRQVDGYWQPISADDDNFAIDGGELVVLDTNVKQSGSLFRARLRNEVATAYSAKVSLAVAAPSTAKREISAGTVTWGVKESFRTYVTGPIAHGEITVTGATTDADGVFRWPVTGGTYDPVAETTTATLAGTVRFTGHAGVLDLTISSPTLTLTGTSGTLTADVTSKDESSGKVVSYPRVVVAEVDAGSAVSAGGDVVAVQNAGTVLAAAGAPAFGGFYQAGTTLDPVSAQLTLGDEVGTTTPPVTKPDVTTRTTVTLARSTHAYGASTSATVRARTVAGVAASGKVTVTVSGTTTTATLKNGAATVALPRTVRPGTWSVSAVYAGAAGVSGSRATATLKVTKAKAKATLKLAKAKIKAKKRATVTVKVTVPGTTGATGVVVVRDGSRVLAVKTLRAKHQGKVTLRLPRLTKGKHTIRATVTADPLHSSATTARRVLRVR